MTHLQSVILAIVEGLTEYLPISSTGHLILTSAVMGINENDFVKDYTVIVQFGAILSVVVLYWRRFLSSIALYKKLLIGILPAVVIGLAFKHKIDDLLGSVWVVAISMVTGGIVLVFMDRIFPEKFRERTIETLENKQAGVIGLIQCAAFFPGMSRSAATIFGGLSQRMTRKDAAEFSFLLAVPTLTGATCLKLLKIYKTITPDEVSLLLIGNVISFIVGIITIRAFIGYLQRGGFRVFGIYRVIVGTALILWMATGHSLSVL